MCSSTVKKIQCYCKGNYGSSTAVGGGGGSVIFVSPENRHSMSLSPVPPPGIAELGLIALHGFACASCTKPGSETKPVERTVVMANMAALKIFLFNLTNRRVRK
jgi:hypothetical protein